MKDAKVIYDQAYEAAQKAFQIYKHVVLPDGKDDLAACDGWVDGWFDACNKELEGS